MAQGSEARGCFKFGCFGCLGAIVLLVGLPLLLGVIGFAMGSPEPEYETVELGRQLPEGEGAKQERELPAEDPDGGTAEEPSVVTGADPGASGTTDLGGSGPTPLDLADAPAPPGPPGRVRLELSIGEFEVVRGPQAEGIRVEAEYDRATFDLKERFEEGSDGGWLYTLALENRVSWLRRMWGDEESFNKIRVILPENHPIALEGEISLGKSVVELGGLWITTVDLDFEMGEHEVIFDAPGPEPMERFALNGSFGEIGIEGLGYASPATVSLDGSFGEFRADLTGPWQRDAEVALEFGFGECTVTVPDGVRTEFSRATMAFGEKHMDQQAGDLPEDAPTLHMNMEGSFGEMRLNRVPAQSGERSL